MFLAQISVVWMKSATFLSALAKEVFFCSAKQNLNYPFFSPFKKEVYATPSSKFGMRTASLVESFYKLC